MTLNELRKTIDARIKDVWSTYLKPSTAVPAPLLNQAISHSLFNGGKRLRPLLVYITGLTLGAKLENLDPPAAAIELIHCYSLIHDDLPAMDNANLRRGKPTCHKVYGETVAILAGDAMQPLAFEILAAHPATLLPQQRLQMIRALSQASGLQGIAAGQVLDTQSYPVTLAGLDQLHGLKTGSLFQACLDMGYAAANNENQVIKTALHRYGHCLGLAYQIQDDLLDIESNALTLGKENGIDSLNNKTTYPGLAGIEKTREHIENLFHEAMAAVTSFDQGLLKEFALFLLKRQE